jgi:hypothetical protein
MFLADDCLNLKFAVFTHNYFHTNGLHELSIIFKSEHKTSGLSSGNYFFNFTLEIQSCRSHFPRGRTYASTGAPRVAGRLIMFAEGPR